MSKFDDEVVKKAEEHLNKKVHPPLILLTDTIQGGSAVSVHALFTKMDNAMAYMKRKVVNFLAEVYSDDIDEYTEKDIESFHESVYEHLRDFYHLSIVTHLDPKLPVYQLQSGNYICRGDPSEYLTNDGETLVSDWRQQCLVRINPPLPELFRVPEHEN
jgi:hypothetical protein